MAKFSQRQMNTPEIKYLYRAWSRMDSSVRLPESLTGNALLPLLDDIEQPAPPAKNPRFSPRVFTWQSGVTYAAAFVLIVALSAFFGRGDSQADILQGQISMLPADTQREAYAVQDKPAEAPVQPASGEAQRAGGDFVGAPATDESSGTMVMAESGETETEAVQDGVGGPGESIALGQDETYTYTYRANDPTDPDKKGFPIAVAVMETATGELAAAFDLPDIMSVAGYFVHESNIVLIGPSEDGTAVYVYEISGGADAPELFGADVAGSYIDAHLYGGVLHLLTFAEPGIETGCEVIALPDGSSEAKCVVTAVDLSDMSTISKAFSGAGEDITLYNLHAYINYSGEQTETNATGSYVAQIRLDGMNIELNNP